MKVNNHESTEIYPGKYVSLLLVFIVILMHLFGSNITKLAKETGTGMQLATVLWSTSWYLVNHCRLSFDFSSIHVDKARCGIT